MGILSNKRLQVNEYSTWTLEALVHAFAAWEIFSEIFLLSSIKLKCETQLKRINEFFPSWYLLWDLWHSLSQCEVWEWSLPWLRASQITKFCIAVSRGPLRVNNQAYRTWRYLKYTVLGNANLICIKIDFFSHVI